MDAPETHETDYTCPEDGCDETLVYGHYADAHRGIRGYSCSECNLIWTGGQLKRLGVK